MHVISQTPSSALSRIALLLLIAFAAEARTQAQLQAHQDMSLPPNTSVVIHKLMILSSDLPEARRKQIITAYEGRGYRPQEFAEKVRQVLRDDGYYNAVVEDPLLTGVGNIDKAWSADVTLHVSAGAQYRLSEIHFAHVSVFTPALLREQFHIEQGGLFSATAISRGLERVKNLYVEDGYVRFGAIPTPQIDEAGHTIVLTVDVDEGRPSNFGSLILQGREPRPDASKRLLATWTSGMEGKRYSLTVLKHWLSANAPWWSDTPEGMLYIANLPGLNPQRIDIRLEFP